MGRAVPISVRRANWMAEMRKHAARRCEIVSEILDIRTRNLFAETQCCDYVLSNELMSKTLAMARALSQRGAREPFYIRSRPLACPSQPQRSPAQPSAIHYFTHAAIYSHSSSLIPHQVSEDRLVNLVLKELFSAGGNDIYIRKSADYVFSGEELSFFEVQTRCRHRGEVRSP